MKKLLSFFCIALAILALLSSHAFSRGKGGGGGGGNNNNDNNQSASTPTPAPSPTPAPAPVQGIISNVTPFAVSIKTTPQTAEVTFKLSRDTTITINGMPGTIAALKPGMIATITLDGDNIYATAVAASIPAPIAASTPVPSQPSASSSNTLPPGATPPPFGRIAPY